MSAGRYALAGAVVLHLMLGAAFFAGVFQPQGQRSGASEDAVLVDLAAVAPGRALPADAEDGPEQSAMEAVPPTSPSKPPEIREPVAPPGNVPSKSPELADQKVEQATSAGQPASAVARTEMAPTGPDPAARQDAALALTAWQKALVSHIQAARKGARPGGLEGTALISFTIDHEGHLISARVEKSSGAAVLDQAALLIIKRAAPFSRPPESATHLDFVVPIAFRRRS